MSLVMRLCLTLLVWPVAAGAGWGQNPLDEPPALAPARPRTRSEREHLEALQRYTAGLRWERSHHLLEAVQSFEEAVRIDPEAAAPRKSLIPLYLVLNREADALAACRRVLDLAPDDYETWCLYARQLKAHGQGAEAAAALARALACPDLRDDAELFAEVAFDLGRLSEDAQDYVGAAAAFGEALAALKHEDVEASPAPVYESLGRVCARAGRPRQAVEAYTRARALFQEQDPLAARRLDYPLATAWADLGRPADALRCLDGYLLTQPPDTEPYELKICLLRQLGRQREAVPALREAADRDPNNVALKLFLARQLVQDGQAREAERLYLKLAADLPRTEVYRGLFTLYQGERRMGEALDLLNQTVAAATDRDGRAGEPAARVKARAMVASLRDAPGLAPDLVAPARSRLRDGRALEPETRRFLAAVAARAHQLDAAEELYRSCLDGSPAPANEPAVYQGLLQVLWTAGKHEAVAATCRRGLAHAEGGFRLLLFSNLARALGLLGKTEEALAEVDEAARLSADAQLHFRLLRAEILERARRFDQAEAECLALLREDRPADAVRRVRYTLSGVYSAARQLPKAEEQLRLILQGDPDDASACNDLGYLLADQKKDLEEAERLIRKAIKLDAEQRQTAHVAEPEEDDGPNAAYIDSLGWVLFRRGRLAEARREMEKAAALPDGAADPVVWDHLGDVYLGLGEREQARRAWRQAVTIYETDRRRPPDDQYQEIKHKLQRPESEPHP